MGIAASWSKAYYNVRFFTSPFLPVNQALIIVGMHLSICVLFLGAFIPLWILPDTFSPLSAGAFFVQAGVQGAWGVVRLPLSRGYMRAYMGLI